MKTFYLPDLGEGLPDAEIVTWHVTEGKQVKEDELLVSMETAKAVVEVPSPFTGTISKLYGKPGDIIKTGAPLVAFDVKEKKDSGTVAGKIEEGNQIVQDTALTVSGSGRGVKVLPAVRALAKKLGVDLSLVKTTGANGIITADDVKLAASNLNQAGPITPLRGTRRAMATTMAAAHREVVPVTIYEDADIHAWAKQGDYTVRVIQAMVKACQAEPALNVWFDAEQMGRRMLKDIHLGLAMDTADGLFVPVMKDVHTKDAASIRTEINELKQAVQTRAIKPESLQGATIVLSNFGKFAGRYASPVVVPPTVAILGVGALRKEVKVVNDDPKVIEVLPLSLTFDHRAVTGGEATRFLRYMLEALEKKS